MVRRGTSLNLSSSAPLDAAARPARRPLRDRAWLIFTGVLLLWAILVVLVVLADRSTTLAPDFLAEVVLYGLTAAVLTLLGALVFVLARNLVKLLVERRRGLPFAHFRTKLVLAMLALTLVPAVLVLIVGSELIRSSTERWFSAPVSDVLGAASRIASTYYAERQAIVAEQAARLARLLAQIDLATAQVQTLRDLIGPEVASRRVARVELFRVVRDGGRVDVQPLVEVAASSLPPGPVRAAADRLAARVAAGSPQTRVIEPLDDGGELVRVAAGVPAPGGGALAGVVVASDHLTGELARDARRITDAYEAYTQLRVLKRPLAGVYLSFFVMITLMILMSATWTGFYLAKRITRPVQRLAAAAREIGAGHLDHRIERETTDEFGALVDAFNAMAEELAASQRSLERSRLDLERQNRELEVRRRYIETILERVATGVISTDAAGRIHTLNSAAARLLGLERSVVGERAAAVLARPDLAPLGTLVASLASGTREPVLREVALARDGREIHLAVAVTALAGGTSGFEGLVLVLDDVTPLIRAQRVAAWRDVARRLAHEIKNPLTPIQLSAERLRRHFQGAPPAARALVEECTATIVTEVEVLKALVDEFAQFARMPAPRAVPTDLDSLVDEALGLYQGLFPHLAIERRRTTRLPPVRVDPEQVRRVIINLVDNAIEALNTTVPTAVDGDRGRIVVETEHDASSGVVRLVVADNGPGIPPGDRDKLFMPYYSTKGRGSGLGLAIVRRIVVEHGGTIEVGDNPPRGTRFTIELPAPV
jgi:two-component system nitrogen regulation sensor histidine kinase NtrY